MCADVKTQQRLASAFPGFHQPRPKRETGGVAQPQSLSILICKMVERRVKVAQSCLTLCLSYNPWDSPGQNTGVGSLSLYLDGKFGTKLPGTCEPPLRQLQNTSDRSLPDVNTHNWVLMMKARRALPAITSKTPGRRGEVFTLFSLMHDLSFIQEALRGSSSKPGCRGECRGWVTA